MYQMVRILALLIKPVALLSVCCQGCILRAVQLPGQKAVLFIFNVEVPIVLEIT